MNSRSVLLTMKPRLASVGLACWGVGIGIVPSEASHRFAKARELIVADVESGAVPAFAVAVARGDEILWEEAFGSATTDTLFSLASVSKPITATGLMVLVERDQVELDRPINDYLGDTPLVARVGRAREATVRRVANHTSGLPLHHHFFPLGKPPRPPPMKETIERYGNLVSEPGERFQYSNLGYGVIEHVIERVSKQDFQSFMEEAVFRPLGMRNAAVVLDPASEKRPLATRHDRHGQAIPFYDFDHRGASAIYSSVHDLLRFGMFHVRTLDLGPSSILSKRAIREMQKTKARIPGGRHYGIGWVIYENRWGERTVEHGGGMPGVSASLYLIPDRKIVVVTLASARSELPKRVTDAVIDTLIRRIDSEYRIGRIDAAYRRIPASASRRVNARDRKRKNPKAFVGVWDGAIETHDGAVPLRLIIERASPVRARLGVEPEVSLMVTRFDGDRLSGMMRAPRPNGAMFRLSLRRQKGSLSGAVTTLAEESGLPLALTHWADLEKASTDGSSR